MRVLPEPSDPPQIGRNPDFIGLGVAKSGTTWLYDNLAQHPEIAFAKASRDITYCFTNEQVATLQEEGEFLIKEVQYWNHLYDPFSQVKVKYFDGYRALFAYADKNQVTGEITNNYSQFLLDKAILKFMADHLPDVKLFMIMRNPIERFFSHYSFLEDIDNKLRQRQLHGGFRQSVPEKLMDGIEELKKILSGKVIDPFNPMLMRLFTLGLYDVCIQNVLTRYDPSKLYLMLFDDIKSQPNEVFRNLCNYLGVNSAYAPPTLNKKSNPTKAEKQYGQAEYDAMADLYRNTIKNLSVMMNRDLSHWLSYSG